VSDTPRTDKVLYSVDVCDGEDVVNIEFARTLESELNAANDRIKRQEEALRRIANQDYRGNRSTESQIAFEALKEVKP
jgi:hypothetical protein